MKDMREKEILQKFVNNIFLVLDYNLAYNNNDSKSIKLIKESFRKGCGWLKEKEHKNYITEKVIKEFTKTSIPEKTKEQLLGEISAFNNIKGFLFKRKYILSILSIIISSIIDLVPTLKETLKVISELIDIIETLPIKDKCDK